MGTSMGCNTYMAVLVGPENVGHNEYEVKGLFKKKKILYLGDD
jgi:hypothetical protein